MDNIIELIAITISGISLILTVVNFFISRRHDRKQATLDAFNVLQEQALDELNAYTGSEIKNLPASNKNADYRKVSTCLARIEHFCVGVNQKIYDIRVVRELAGDYMKNAYLKLEPIINTKNRVMNKNYYNNFEKVYKLLSDK